MVVPVSKASGFPNSEPRSVNIFSKVGINSEFSISFFRWSKVSLIEPWVYRLGRKARNIFLSEEESQQSLIGFS